MHRSTHYLSLLIIALTLLLVKSDFKRLHYERIDSSIEKVTLVIEIELFCTDVLTL